MDRARWGVSPTAAAWGLLYVDTEATSFRLAGGDAGLERIPAHVEGGRLFRLAVWRTGWDRGLEAGLLAEGALNSNLALLSRSGLLAEAALNPDVALRSGAGLGCRRLGCWLKMSGLAVRRTGCWPVLRDFPACACGSEWCEGQW
jgi:hypothetical protein